MRTKFQRRNHQCVNEIDGYMDLGMKEEALDIVRQTLSKSAISADEFQSCVFALLQSERPELWKRQVESAYRRLPTAADDQVRSAMLNFYFSAGDPKKAFLFFPGRSTRFFDAWTMMQVCLELGRLDEAKKVARYCQGVLASAEDNFTKASMADALASYYLRIGNCEEAINLWQEAPDEPAFQRQRLTGIVKARLLQASQAAELGLTIVTQMKNQPDQGIEIHPSGNTAALFRDTECELKQLQRAIEAVREP